MFYALSIDSNLNRLVVIVVIIVAVLNMSADAACYSYHFLVGAYIICIPSLQQTHKQSSIKLIRSNGNRLFNVFVHTMLRGIKLKNNDVDLNGLGALAIV